MGKKLVIPMVIQWVSNIGHEKGRPTKEDTPGKKKKKHNQMVHNYISKSLSDVFLLYNSRFGFGKHTSFNSKCLVLPKITSWGVMFLKDHELVETCGNHEMMKYNEKQH